MYLILYSADTRADLARPDISSFSDQILIENMLEQCTALTQYDAEGNHVEFKDADGNYVDFCATDDHGHGITCDAAGNVTEIEWRDKLEVRDVLSLDMLPPNLISFALSCPFTTLNSISVTVKKLPQSLKTFGMYQVEDAGRIDVELLPPGMEGFCVSYCNAHGTLNCASLRPPLRYLSLYVNKFYGKVNLGALPSTLKRLDLGYNQFTGSVALCALPRALERLTLENNRFSGEVNLASLPEHLNTLDLSKNNFSGEIFLQGGDLPAGLQHLKLENLADLSGTIDLSSGTPREIYMYTQNSPIKVIRADVREKEVDGSMCAVQ